MNEATPISNEILGPRPLLRDVLAEITFKPGRIISPFIDGLDLGVFSDEARQLANSCFLDPDNSDTGKVVYVTGKKKVLLPNYSFRAFKGGALSVIFTTSAIPRAIAEKNGLDHRYLGMVIHTRKDTDKSFSATDLSGLMLSDSDSHAPTAAFISGKTRNMLFFRGQNTPQLSAAESERKAKLWLWQLEERIGEFIKPNMDKEEKINIIERAEKALLRQICQKYDIQFFSGDTNNTFVSRQTP